MTLERKDSRFRTRLGISTESKILVGIHGFETNVLCDVQEVTTVLDNALVQQHVSENLEITISLSCEQGLNGG